MKLLNETDARAKLIEAMDAMDRRGLNRGTSGNVSLRYDGGVMITPTGVTPAMLTPEKMVPLGEDGTPHPGALRPSSEWRMHLGVLARRPELNAVVHCHSRHATILACAGLAIPAVHYMVGVAGGRGVPLAPYEPFGSTQLADAVADALHGGYACLMANHGLIAISATVDRALAIAEEIEEQAAVYWGTLAIGGPKLLSDDQMDDILHRFRNYGQKR